VAGWTVGFVDATESRWTGIQVKRDPGTWVVWVGFILVMAGCAVAFGLSHRRLWIRARRVGGRTICHVAASTHRGRPVLNAGLDDLCRQWERMARLRPAQEGGVDG
jgi:cytochrome c biogenesis protein